MTDRNPLGLSDRSASPPVTSAPKNYSSSATTVGSSLAQASWDSRSSTDQVEMNRRESLERDLTIPRKRIAIEISEREDEGERVSTTSDAVGTQAVSNHSSNKRETGAEIVHVVSDDEAAAVVQVLSEASSSSTGDPAVRISPELTTIERVILRERDLDDGENAVLPIESFILELRSALRSFKPHNWILALNEYLEKFTELSDDERAGFWDSGIILFQELPSITCELWYQTQSLSEDFWEEDGEFLLVKFFKLFNSVAIYAFNRDYIQVKSDVCSMPESMVSKLYAQALSRIFTVTQDGVLSGFDNFDAIVTVPLQFVDEHGLEAIANIWREVMNSGVKVNGKLLEAILPQLDLVANLSWTLFRSISVTSPQSPIEDASLSSSASSTASSTINQKISSRFPYDRFLEFFNELEGTLVGMTDFSDGIDRNLLVAIVDKLSTPFFVLLQIPDSDLINMHPSTRSVLKLSNTVSTTDIRKASNIIRKFYWWVKLFQSPRADLKLFGIKKITSDLNAFYRNNSPDTPSIVTACAAIMEANCFTEHLTSSEAHAVYITHFAPTIYSVLSIYGAISVRDLDRLWSVMISGPVPFDAICSLFIQLTSIMSLEVFDWLLTVIPQSIRQYEPSILKLIEATTQNFNVRAHQTEDNNEDASSNLLNQSRSMLLSIIDITCNLSREEEAKMKVRPRALVDITIRCVSFLMDVDSNMNSKFLLFKDALAGIVPFKPSTLKNLILMRSYWDSLKSSGHYSEYEASQMFEHMQREPWHESIIENIKKWYEYCRQREPVSDLYEIDVIYRQIALTKSIKKASIDPTDLDILWQALGPNDLASVNLVDSLWINLCELADNVKQASSFLEYCFDKIKTLPKEYLTATVVNFIMKYLNYRFRITNSNFLSEENAYIIPRFDTFWHVYLNTLDEDSLAKYIEYIVWLFMDSEYVTSESREVIDKCHQSLIKHCISCIDDAGKCIATGDEATAPLIYRRSFRFLDSFLDAYRQHALYNVRTSVSSRDASYEVKGKPISIKLQWHSYKFTSAIENLSIGEDNSVFELHSQISNIVGDPNFRMFCMGSEIRPKDFGSALKDIGFRDVTALMIVKRPQLVVDNYVQDSESVLPSVTNSTNQATPISENLSEPTSKQFSPAEQELMNNFDIVYSLLRLPDAYASPAWNCLQKVGPASKILQSFLDPKEAYGAWEELFPPQYSFQTLYSDYVLQCVYTLYQKNQIEKNWMENCFIYIIPQLLKLAVRLDLGSTSTPMVQSFVRSTLLSRIVTLLREETTVTSNHLTQDEVELLVLSLAGVVDDTLKDLSESVLDVLLILSRLDVRIWNELKKSDAWKQVFERCLLLTMNESVRSYYNSAILDFIKTLMQNNSGIKESALVYFWEIVKSILPKPNDESAKRASTLFMLAEYLLRALMMLTDVEISKDSDLLLEWYTPLTIHKSTESLFSSDTDNIINGYSKLMLATIECRRDKSAKLDLSYLSLSTFLDLLFAANRDKSAESATEEYIGCVVADTRISLYKVLIALTESNRGLSDVVSRMLMLFSKDGVLHDAWNTDRSRWLRADCGFVGLQNLANTCYVNSFVNQLYMNEEFRSSIFGLKESQDSGGPNNSVLLETMIELFAYLGYGWQKMADPRHFIQSIVDFENKPIDISVQMDVDEFYNLLFDRIEGQITDPSKKLEIKNCYGGSLLTQIKSKECIHVSERIEPFSAIQCDIKGKRNLIESLNSYVEGETMDGDNKYWCSQCEAHVNAEKRICLKDAPNHLIFHLKRFDFDLQTMQRSKINERFEFPMEIDIEPFTFNHFQQLQDIADSEGAEITMAKDNFRLVGILVHSGTAESGHYYSYIMNKSATEEKYRWIEFNDAEVSLFDASNIANSCFGGGSQSVNGDMMEKPFSAYMLFYDRISPKPTTSVVDRKTNPCPQSLHSTICRGNEKLAMKWAVFGSEHLQFVLSCYQRISQKQTTITINESDIRQPYENHHLLLFETFFQIVSRIKESKEVEQYLTLMQKSFQSNPRNSLAFLVWLTDTPSSLRGLIIRCPNLQVRGGVVVLIRLCLRTIKRNSADVYGTLRSWVDCLVNQEDGHLICRFFMKLGDLIPNIPVTSRAWDEYFEFLSSIADFGPDERAIFVYAGLLHKSLVAFYDDRHVASKSGPAWLDLRVADKRKPSYNVIICFILKLLNRVDVGRDYADSMFDRCPPDLSDEEAVNTVSLTIPEAELLCRGAKKNRLEFLYRLLEAECPPEQAVEFIKIYLQLDSRASVLSMGLVFDTLTIGLESESPEVTRAFLMCILKLSSVYTFSQRDCEALADHIFKNLETMVSCSGEAYMYFISHAISSEETPDIMKMTIKKQVAIWAPSLLVHWKKSVREMAEFNVELVLFRPLEALDRQLEALAIAINAAVTSKNMDVDEAEKDRTESTTEEEEDEDEDTTSPPVSAHASAPPVVPTRSSFDGITSRQQPFLATLEDEHERFQKKKAAYLNLVVQLVKATFSYIDGRYRSQKVRLSSEDLNFESICSVLQECSHVLDDEDTTVKTDELIQELRSIHVQNEDAHSDWTSDGDVVSDIDEGYLMELEEA